MIYSAAHGDTAFTVPRFDAYLRRVMPTWAKPATDQGLAAIAIAYPKTDD